MTGAAGYIKFKGLYICPYMDGFCIKADRSDAEPLYRRVFVSTVEAKKYIRENKDAKTIKQ